MEELYGLHAEIHRKSRLEQSDPEPLLGRYLHCYHWGWLYRFGHQHQSSQIGSSSQKRTQLRLREVTSQGSS